MRGALLLLRSHIISSKSRVREHIAAFASAHLAVFLVKNDALGTEIEPTAEVEHLTIAFPHPPSPLLFAPEPLKLGIHS